MNKVESHNIEIEWLTKYINEVRDVLNEMCITMDENKNDDYILSVSKFLDELIVEYIKRTDTNNEYIGYNEDTNAANNDLVYK